MGLLVLIVLLSGCSPGGAGPSRIITSTPGTASQPGTTPEDSPRQTSTPAPTPRTTSSLEINPDDLQDMEVVFWHFFPEEHITPLVRAFNQDNPWGITVETRHFGDAQLLAEALDGLAAATGPAPTVIAGYPEQLAVWDQQELLVELSALVEDPEWGFSEDEQAAFVPAFWQQNLAGESLLGLPARREARFLIYNESWAQALNYRQPPDSPVTFRRQACAANIALKDDALVQNDGYGGWLVDTSPETMLAWLQAFGGQVLSPSGATYRFETEQNAEAFAFLKDLVDNTCAWVSSDVYPEEAFAARRALLATARLVDLPFIEQAFAEADNPDEWSILPFPASGAEPSLPVYGPSLALLQDDPERVLAGWLFMRWLTSPESQAFWTRLDGQFPVSTSAAALLEDYAAEHPQWAAAWELLPLAISEPQLPSWWQVRWALADAGTQIFRSYFTADRIEATLEELDRTADELSR
jgi:multiple sugar transport system substrate-binding protein/sn-glycerol 3-phosphate transport system substrate-binding protein